MQHARSSANFTKLCQFISWGFFSITVCVKQWDEGVACQQQLAPKLNAAAAGLTTDSRQWLVTTPETGFKVVRVQQPPLTKETLPPHRHLSSLEHPPTY